MVDLKTKEEKDAELDRRIEALRKKNEALMKRHQVLDVTQAFHAFTVYFMSPAYQACVFVACNSLWKNMACRLEFLSAAGWLVPLSKMGGKKACENAFVINLF